MIKSTSFNGLYIIEPDVYKDNRGFFFEAYNQKFMCEAGLNMNFVQDSQSLSKRGVLRGMHLQKDFPQGKLVRCINGRIWDVVVDLRKESKTFGKWYGIELSAENRKQLYIPENFGHGFLTLSDEAEVLFKVTDFYHPGDEIGFTWNDPDIDIKWPISDEIEIILAEKDMNWPGFKELF